MADTIDYDRLAEAIAEAVSSGSRAEQFKAEADNYKKAAAEQLKFVKTMREAGSATKIFQNIITGQRVDFAEAAKKARDELDRLSEQYKQSESEEAKRQILEQQRETKRAAMFNSFGAAMTNASLGLIKFGKTTLDSVGSAGAQLARSLQSSGNGMQMGAGLLTAGVDLANSAAQGLSGGITSLGTGMMTFLKGPWKMLGAGVTGLGAILGGLSNSVARLAKFGIDVLQVELERTLRGFRETTRSGALFADGLEGMRRAAGAAMLTVEQFANVLSKHSEDLALLGFGVTKGAQRMGDVMVKGGDRMRIQLLNLGYSFEEQAGLVAETMSMMRGMGGPLRATDAEIVEQTTKYAESLRLIAGITGEDAKRKMDQAKQQARVLGFQQWLAGKDEKQRQNIIAAMSQMTDLDRKNFMDRAVLGTVVNKEGAIFESTIKGARQRGEDFYRMAEQGNLNAESAARLIAESGSVIKESTMGQKSLGIAAYVLGGQLGVVADGMLQNVEQAQKYTADSVAAMVEAVKQQKETTNDLTKSLNEAATAAQKMAIDFQKLLDPFLKMYADVTKMMMTQIQETFEEMRKQIVGMVTGEKVPENKRMQEFKKGVGEKAAETEAVGSTVKNIGFGAMGLGALTTLAGLATTFTGFGAAAGVPLMAAGGKMMLGGAGVAVAGKTVEGAGEFAKQQVEQESNFLRDIGKMFGYRRGGVSRGPDEGYLQKLHGTEAVIPLPDGKEIPVKLDIPRTMVADIAKPGEASSGQFIDDIIKTNAMFRDVINYGSTTLQTTFDSIARKSTPQESLVSTYIDNILSTLSTGSMNTVSKVIDEFSLTSNSFLKQLTQTSTQKQEQTMFGSVVTKDSAAQLANTTATAFDSAVSKIVNGAIDAVNTASKSGKELLDSVDRSLRAGNITDLTLGLKEFANKMKENAEDSFKSSATVTPIAVKSVEINKESIVSLKAAIGDQNEQLKELLEEQNNLLKQNVDSMGRLADLMSNGNSISARMYRDLT